MLWGRSYNTTLQAPHKKWLPRTWRVVQQLPPLASPRLAATARSDTQTQTAPELRRQDRHYAQAARGQRQPPTRVGCRCAPTPFWPSVCRVTRQAIAESRWLRAGQGRAEQSGGESGGAGTQKRGPKRISAKRASSQLAFTLIDACRGEKRARGENCQTVVCLGACACWVVA